MVHRIRVAIVGAVAVTAAIALAGSGLASAAMERVGTVVLPASAAVHPTEVDVTGRFRSDPGWGIAQGAIVPAPAPGVAAGSRMLARPATTGTAVAGPVVAGGSSLRDIELARAGLIPGSGCSGTACGTDGCGFLAPGCALLDCSLLNPACGLGVPVSSCGILDPGCGFGRFGHCGLLDSRCGSGLDDDRFDRRFRFRDLFFHDRFFHDHFFDRHLVDRHRSDR
ncbi:MAG: hypothetical protein JWM18_4221 [Chloroflexi bacterium]|jgi:hypothetical protein|nr:hypothetical protein [Chloroflexota bacterium]